MFFCQTLAKVKLIAKKTFFLTGVIFYFFTTHIFAKVWLKKYQAVVIIFLSV